MRRPRAVRFFAFATCPTPLRQGGRKSALTSAELYGGFTNSTLYKNRAPRVFSANLQNAPLGQSRAIPAPWRFPPVGYLFTPQVAVCAIVENVADAIFNRGLQLICLCTMSAPRVFSANLQNAPLGQSRVIPASWRFPAVGCLFTPQVAVCAIVKKMSQTLILNC